MNLDAYTNRLASEHKDKPKFAAVMAAICQPFVDEQAVLSAMPAGYDVDLAVGVQLDTVGEWVGVSRYVTVPLTGVFFAFDTDGVGFDQGTWFGPYDTSTGLTRLPDDAYRTLLYARISNNQWNGTVPGAYEFLNALFVGNTVIIQDNGDMTMLYGIAGNALTAVQTALLQGGYLDVKPAGVRISNYIAPSVSGPLFGFDIENSTISGFDVGGWATLTPGR